MENNDKITLGSKLEKAFLTPRNSSNTVEDSLDIIATSENLSIFFKKLAEDKNLKKLIFLHRFDLFKIGEVSVVPYLHYCPLPKRKSKAQQNIAEAQILTHIVDAKHAKGEVKGQKFFSEIEEKDEGFADLGRIILFFMVHFTRSNPKILNLVSNPDFNFKAVCDELKKEENPIDLGKYFEEMFANFDDPKKFDPIVKAKLEKLLMGLASKGGIMAGPSIENISGMIPDVMMQFHKISFEAMMRVLGNSDLTYKEYEGVINTLYLCKLIENKSSMLWCESCSRENLTYNTYFGKASPQNFKSPRKCLSCGHKEMFSAIYGLNLQFKDILYSKDGLLSVYFGWLLDKYAVSYDSSEYVNDYESDFIVRDKILVECKVLAIPKDKQALQSKLFGALKQMETNISNLIKEGKKITKAGLLLNLWNIPKDTIDAAEAAFPQLFKKYQLSIVGPNEIEGYVHTLL